MFQIKRKMLQMSFCFHLTNAIQIIFQMSFCFHLINLDKVIISQFSCQFLGQPCKDQILLMWKCWSYFFAWSRRIRKIFSRQKCQSISYNVEHERLEYVSEKYLKIYDSYLMYRTRAIISLSLYIFTPFSVRFINKSS